MAFAANQHATQYQQVIQSSQRACKSKFGGNQRFLGIARQQVASCPLDMPLWQAGVEGEGPIHRRSGRFRPPLTKRKFAIECPDVAVVRALPFERINGPPRNLYAARLQKAGYRTYLRLEALVAVLSVIHRRSPTQDVGSIDALPITPRSS